MAFWTPKCIPCFMCSTAKKKKNPFRTFFCSRMSTPIIQVAPLGRYMSEYSQSASGCNNDNFEINLQLEPVA